MTAESLTQSFCQALDQRCLKENCIRRKRREGGDMSFSKINCYIYWITLPIEPEAGKVLSLTMSKNYPSLPQIKLYVSHEIFFFTVKQGSSSLTLYNKSECRNKNELGCSDQDFWGWSSIVVIKNSARRWKILKSLVWHFDIEQHYNELMQCSEMFCQIFNLIDSIRCFSNMNWSTWICRQFL